MARALTDHPEMRIVTDLVHYLADVAVFKAEIYLDDVLVATGWEEEIRGTSGVNRTSHVANAETSAIGRALANMGYAGSDPTKRPSREEMSKVQRMGGGTSSASAQSGSRVITNKYPNACIKCGARVEAGAGLAAQNVQGKWETWHKGGECTTEEAF